MIQARVALYQGNPTKLWWSRFWRASSCPRLRGDAQGAALDAMGRHTDALNATRRGKLSRRPASPAHRGI